MSRRPPLFLLCVFLSVLLFACSHTPRGKSHDGFDGLTLLLDFYEGPLDHLSAVRSGQCPMFPSCASYSRQCVERFGPLVGWMMACDRLMRCGRDEMHLSPRVLVDGQWLIYDPVAANTPRPDAGVTPAGF